jgi:hypothetical protein
MRAFIPAMPSESIPRCALNAASLPKQLKQPPMQRKLPDAPTQRCHRHQHHPHAKPSRSARRTTSHSISPDILCEFSPIRSFRTPRSTLAQTGFKSLNPRSFFQADDRQVVPQNAFPEHAARQRVKVACLERKQMARRNLRLLANRFDRDVPPFSFFSKLVAEFHSIRSVRNYSNRCPVTASSPKNRTTDLSKSKPHLGQTHSCYYPEPDW